MMSHASWRPMVAFLALVVAGACTTAEEKAATDDAEELWRQAFLQHAAEAAAPTNNASEDQPYGRPHPDAPSGLAQFAFLIGEHGCEANAPKGVNPHNPNDVIATPFHWSAEYILNGRAIRDEWADVNSTGSQTRLYDPETDQWETRWVGIGLLEGFGLFEPNGVFVLKAGDDGSISGVFAERVYNGDLYRSVITFSEISRAGFEWRLQNYKDDKPFGEASRISCRRTKG